MSRVKHVHIRDCKGMQSGPGKPEDQVNGRGDIDLLGFVRVLHEHGYDGALNLEVIFLSNPRAREYSLEHRRRVRCTQGSGALRVARVTMDLVGVN